MSERRPRDECRFGEDVRERRGHLARDGPIARRLTLSRRAGRRRRALRSPMADRAASTAGTSCAPCTSTASGSNRAAPGDAHRQRRVEQEAVQHAWAHRAHQPNNESSPADAASPSPRCEHAQLSDIAECLELPPRRLVERKAETRTADDQDLHGRGRTDQERSTSARTRVAYSGGAAYHCSEPSRAANPSCSASSAFDSTFTSAAASAPASFEGTSNPFSPSTTRSSIRRRGRR